MNGIGVLYHSAMKVCPQCKGSLDLPHPTDEECFRAVDREIAATVRQLRILTRRKGKLLSEPVRARQRAGVTRRTVRPTRRTLMRK